MDTSSEVQRRIAKLGLQSYSSVDLKCFTTNFLESNKIGSGGYGEVYKGQLPKGTLIAVKVLGNMDVVDYTFMVEVLTMGKARHRNLIELYGYCAEDNMKALVYEYMENGSLDRILYKNHHSNIEWVKLYAIAIDIANGLQYLHHGLVKQIIHHDIKASNVVLDKNFSAKIADFGLARIMKRDVSRVDLSHTRGTRGYNAPETWRPQSQVTFKCDVYSFGMMLFEILGKRSNGEAENWFPRLVWNQFENGNLENYITIDCGIAEKDKENANILCKVALWCVQDDPDLRPSMRDVVLMLEKEKPIEDPPCPSPDFRGRLDEMELDSTYPQNIIAGPSHALVAGSDGGVAMPQLKSNKCKTRSPNVLEDNLATLENKGMKLPTTKLVGKTTALKYKEMILQLIAQDEAFTIGVHGMGGVGKTTIVKHVYNQLLAKGKCFNKIIWITVSKDGNITKLQNDLAKELDFNLLSEDDALRRSRLLFQALEKLTRVVFFFDDMWTKISLDEIGIPEPTQENGFKLILTTRKKEVCRRMGCHEDNIIKVEGLPEDEAWELFMNKVDHVLIPEERKIAEMVAKKCYGLPLAIITVGGAMRRNSNIGEWKVALKDLNLRDPSKRMMDMEDNVYECLKFSYDRLENEKQRKCFLCCALYPEDWRIATRDLVDFWIMDGIVEGRTRQDELVEGQYILNKLKDHCLLESIDPLRDEYKEMSDGVKMHDSIREMALRLTNKCFLVKGRGLKELPNEEEWEIDLEKASFMLTKIVDVSISPICPKLSTLILRDIGYLKSVRHDFFVHVKCLKVLDLRNIWDSRNGSLQSLPNSISDLLNLHDLRVGGYQSLKKFPSLAKLVLLRRLELNDTSIEELPEGMEMLVNLRCLNLHEVKSKKNFPIGLLSKLSTLRELYLGGIDVDKLYEVGRGESFAKELLSLRALENLKVTFRCMSDYFSYVGSPKFKELNCFYLTIGRISYGPPTPRATTVDIYDPPDEQIAPVFPKNTKHVEITSFHGMMRLNGLKDVREQVTLRIKWCNKIECIWSSKDENREFSATGTYSSCWLQCLQLIDIDGCTKLYTIFEGIPNYTYGALPVFCLRTLKICYCDNLKNVFPSSRLLQLFQNLEDITIANCDELEELIGDDEEEETETPISIPRLESLWMGFLPKLKSIWRGVMICDSLEHVVVNDCLELKRLPQLKGEYRSTPPPALRHIYGDREWWDSLEWHPAYPKNILQPFFDSDDEDDFESQSDGDDSSMSEGEMSTKWMKLIHRISQIDAPKH